MGLYFSDTTNRAGIVQLIEDRTNTTSATTSSYSLATKTRDVNLAYARFQSLMVRASGRWQGDDTNQTDYPAIYFDLASGQQDYAFTVDASTTPNQMLDVHRVEIRDSVGNWVLLKSFDIKDITVALEAWMPTNGVPAWYDKTSNAVFLYPTPNYNYSRGLKIYYSRTPSYFITTDTTKQAGIPDMFHEYLVLRPSYLYCMAKGMNDKAKAYKEELVEMEQQIMEYYGSRQRDEDPRMEVRNYWAIDKTGVDRQMGTTNQNDMIDYR